MGVLYSNFTSSSDSVFNGALDRGEMKKLVEKNDSLSGVLTFNTDSSFTQRSSACKITSIMLIGSIGVSKTYKLRSMTGYFDLIMSIGENSGTKKTESVSIEGNLTSPNVNVPEWQNISPTWTDNTLIQSSIFGTSEKTCSLSITFRNTDSGLSGRGLNFHMKDLRIAIYYSGASYIYFRSDGNILNSNNTLYSEAEIPSYSGAMEKTGYTFGGWKSSRTGQTYEPGTALPAVDDYDTVYDAVWIENTYTLKFDANGGSGSMSNQTLKYETTGYAPTEEFANPTNTIYYNSNGATQNFKTQSILTKTFKNWIDEKGKIFNVGDPIYQERTGVTGDDQITLYAQWDNVGETLEKPVRQYHAFIGWKDENNPDIIYPEGYNLILTEGNKYLEAQWEKTQPRIFFFKENNNSTSLQRIVLTYLKDKKIKKIFIYIQDNNTLKEV